MLSRRSRLFETHLLIGPRKGDERDETDRGLFYPRPDAMQRRALQERGMHHALMHEGLHLMQQAFTCDPVALRRLLLEQRVEIGITAIGVEARPKYIDLKSIGGVAENRGVGQHEPFELFFPPGG